MNTAEVITNKIVVKKSEFTAHLCKINSQKELSLFLDQYNNPKANHNCYAFIINNGSVSGGMSDDHEPKNTAGKPIFNVIQKNNLENICILVVRKFGGIKLGAGLLSRAYSKAASEIIKIYSQRNI